MTNSLIPVGTRVELSISSLGDRVQMTTGTVISHWSGRLNAVETDGGFGIVMAHTPACRVLSD